MKSLQIGKRVARPVTRRGRWSSADRTRPTRRRRSDDEKPTNHASLNSLVVPVLPPTAKRTPRPRAADPVPRSTTSLSIDTIWKAVSGEITRSVRTGFSQRDAAIGVEDPHDRRAAARRSRRWETSRTRRSARAALTRPVPSESDGTSGMSRSPTSDASRRTGRVTRSAAAAPSRRGCSTRSARRAASARPAPRRWRCAAPTRPAPAAGT